MRTILTIWAAMLTCVAATAQQATWTHRVEPQGADTYRIVLEAQIPARYHMYDMGPYGADGPTATTIVLTPGEGVALEGGVKLLTPPHRYHDEMFDMEIGTLENKAVFEQQVRLTGGRGTVEASLEWMLCDDRSCTPPDDLQLTIRIPQHDAAQTADETPAEETARTAQTAPAAPAKDAAGDKGMWALIIEAVLWGFAALLTPCVFPMVPMTVSYFLKGEGGPAMGRLRAALYGLFIVALYTLPIAAIILITRAAGGDAVTADIFNWLATHWLPNVIFFAVFMLFAASFFGAFEITMPSWLVNKADAKADTKGLGGIFFLALTLVLVSFSCTGPIVGSVLIKSTSGEFWAPILTMLAFSLAFALPFTLFALFPSVLKKLPKSGGWLNSVKVVIGFVEAALGFKFLSVADQTYHWGLMDREIYLAIWIVIFSLLGLYLLGKLKFAHDSDLPYVGVGRLALAIAVFSFVVYMIPGMWGAPLKGLSGYLPPLTTQDFVLTPGSAETPAATTALPQKRKYADFLHLPHGLEGFFDLAEAEAYAAQVGKPLFIDFTGHGCVNCREMEARVWSDPEVLRILRDDYVICALYSDDKKQLPESEWVTTDGGKVLKSLGKINSYYARKTYGANAQPYYILQGRDGKELVPPRGYDLDAEAFAEFLRAGLKAYAAQR
ncbi:MAG: thioredoxin family protein [Alistipes sp.]|nr:thioredoxin family protein [Alistipes sp.]